MNIIGYIHVCQKGQWQRSFGMLVDSIKKSGLYENTQKIRLGVVNDTAVLIEDPILKDDKFEVVYVGKSEEYERATLLHLRNKTESDDPTTLYYYLHTKGLRHFGNRNEQCILDWINLMLYWNIEKWETAIEKLQTHDTYGCNSLHNHYSGNYWWATKAHIMTLPDTIESDYTAPERWVQVVRKNKCCIFKSGLEGMGHYSAVYPRSKYAMDDAIE